MRRQTIHIAAMMLFSGILLSCATTSQYTPGSGNKYQYIYKLISPVENANLLFQDDSVIIQFKFDEAAIQFQLQNVSESNISIDWDKASMGINGRFFPVRHASNLYGDTIHSDSMIMPPLGYIRDVVIPRNNIYYNGSSWVELELLPTTDHHSPALQESIEKRSGQLICLVLPIVFGSRVENYGFDFQVDSVKRIDWKDYVPTKREPAPPSPKHSLLVLDNVTTAVIMVGVLGFSAYLLSVKKSSPSE